MERPAPDLKAAWIAEVDRVAARRRWGRALIAFAGVHLVFFGGLQILLWRTGGRPHWPYPIAWITELVVLILVMKRIAGPGWMREPGMAGVVVRVWGTFFILSFNMASNNDLTGWAIEWYKPTWGTLATFGFATMSWLFDLRFLIPAVGFYFVGLLAVAFPSDFFLLHALAWGATFLGIGSWLERRRFGIDGDPRPARRPRALPRVGQAAPTDEITAG